ncbi:MAG: FIST domain containing protein [Candidatus Eisenbacteria bacterium]|nr:FIST domain containing protein [Candidatus Eisenbacteria bacterium]
MNPETRTQTTRGVSTAREPIEVARELREAIGGVEAALTIFFCAPTYDAQAIGRAMSDQFGDAPLIGCTSAGEITPGGYLSDSVTAVRLPARQFQVATTSIENLGRTEISEIQAVAKELRQQLSDARGNLDGDHCFAFLLIDGLSLREEYVASALHASLAGIPLFGGSAADGLDFGHTWVFHNDRVSENGAVVALVRTEMPFVVFQTQHFKRTGQKMVVTVADSERRIVREINAEPAAREYARILDLSVEDLDPAVFAAHPVVVRIGGQNYVRSIQKVNADQSLTFYCAIDEGIVFTLARGENLVENLRQAFADVRAKVGEPQLVLGCDCILRNLEIERRGMRSEVAVILRANQAVGFSTYGEQIGGMHVNQTFTGVAIGREAQVHD